MWLNKHESKDKHTRTYTGTQTSRWYTICVINFTSKRGRKKSEAKNKNTNTQWKKKKKKNRKAEKEKGVKTKRGIFIKGDQVIFLPGWSSGSATNVLT